MSLEEKPLLVKRYASRRLYNTETSDYVTLDDIADFIRAGREVQIIDLRSGDDLTRRYLLQIVADHETRGDTMLPLNVLTDLVRSYKTYETSAVPEFLSMSFDMIRAGRNKFLKNMESIRHLGNQKGREAIATREAAFYKAISEGLGILPHTAEKQLSKASQDDLSEIKSQLSELQEKLRKLEE